MTAQRFGKIMVWARRLTQAGFFALFIYLFWLARFRDGVEPARYELLFFDLDPLILVGTWLANYAVPAAAFLSLVTLAVTLVFGRVFCGWVCPLGTVHHFCGWLGDRMRRRKRLAQGYSPWQKTKYYLLAALLVMALLGGHWIGVFDPIAQLYRVTTTVLFPGAQYAVEDGANAVYQGDPHVGPLYLKSLTEPVYRFSRDRLFVTDRPAYLASTLIGFIFAVFVLLNLYRRRFWCRYVCPLGAMLGLVAKFQLLRLVNAPKECKECGRCGRVCPSGADPNCPGAWRSSECFGCWNCQPECSFDALTFRFALPTRERRQPGLDLGKRATLAAGAGGVAGLLLMRLTPRTQAMTYPPKLIRPPGAREERAFLQRCLQCGLCMKVCPTNGLHPTGLDAGLEGLWTPKLVPRIGYCAYDCNLCGQVCPTEAIQPLPLEEKHQVKLGLATFDRTRCLPWAFERECLICEEHCPISPKAIYFKEVEVTGRDGMVQTLKQPWVDEDLCIGCGICENVCVFKDKAAIRVTSANESRHPGNQAVLGTGGEDGYFVSAPAPQDAFMESGEEEQSADPYGG